jgi:hypothetical protein
MISEARNRILARSRSLVRGHTPSSNARRAAATARSMSGSAASATVAMVAAVEGSTTSKRRPETGSTHSPSM